MTIFKLDLQFFAQKKGGGSTKNGRDSAGRRLGIKEHDGQTVQAGTILYRQRGSEIKAGLNVLIGKNYTLFATKNGIVKYYRGKGKRTFVKILEAIVSS